MDTIERAERAVRFWKMRQKEIKQIARSVWEIDGKYVLKEYENPDMLKRNVQLLSLLYEMGIPAARIIPTEKGELCAANKTGSYLLTAKLIGSSRSDVKENPALARRMGEIIGSLHLAFRECETKMSFEDSSLLDEMNGWVKEIFSKDQWKMISEEEFEESVSKLGRLNTGLPRQLIHRDVHFGNFLFREGEFTGYLDFDLSQRNIRIFDPCYFMLGMLTEESGSGLGQGEWLEMADRVWKGYEGRIILSETEKKAVPYVMECIELLFAAYFVSIEKRQLAEDAARIYKSIRELEKELQELS